MTWSPIDWRPWRLCAPVALGARRRRRRLEEIVALDERLLLSVNLIIDYSHDTSHFFDTQEKRDLVQQAANTVALSLSDDHLAGITPVGSNRWTASFPEPATGVEE